MFSSTTMASSTTNPVATVSAISEKMLRLYPSRYMTAKVATSDTDTAATGTSVARPLRRNANTTRMTRITAMISVISTSRNEVRIVTERSTARLTSIAGETEARNCGISAFTRSTIPMMLAPGCRYTIIMTASLPLERPRLRRFSTESSTSPTSVSRTAAPLR